MRDWLRGTYTKLSVVVVAADNCFLEFNHYIVDSI